MIIEEPLDLVDQLRVAPECEVGLDAILEREQPELDESRGLVTQRALVAEAGEREPPPEVERFTQAIRRVSRGAT